MTGIKQCPFCAEEIRAEATKCKHCGSIVDGSQAPATAERIAHSTRNKTVAGLLALFLGGLGMHKFYLGQGVQGLFYLLFCWTFIPAIISFFEGIALLLTSDRSFSEKYA